jgi:hypothetical protein
MRAGTRYCGAVCRVDAYRERMKATEGGGEAKTATDAEKADDAGQRRHKSRRARSSSGQEATRRIQDVPTDSAAPSYVRPRRIPFDRQILGQAPPGAVGYRLVFPLGTRSMPKVAPTPDASGGLLFWSLAPFQIPDDIRIQDGHSYRLLWVDSQGRLIPPQHTTHLPALHAFLGPPDPEPSAEDAEYEAILRNVTDPGLRRSVEMTIAESRLDGIELRREAEKVRQRIALSDARVRERNADEQHAREQGKELQKELERMNKRQAKTAAKQEKENSRIRRRNEWLAAMAGFGIPAVTGLIMLLVQKFILKVPVDDKAIFTTVEKMSLAAVGKTPPAAQAETTVATPELVAPQSADPTPRTDAVAAVTPTTESVASSEPPTAPDAVSTEGNQAAPTMECRTESAKESARIQAVGGEDVADSAPVSVAEAEGSAPQIADAVQESSAPLSEAGSRAEALASRPETSPDHLSSIPAIVLERMRYVASLVASRQPLYDAFNLLTETEKSDFVAVLLGFPLECGLLFILDPEIPTEPEVQKKIQAALDSLSDADWAQVRRFADSPSLMTTYRAYCEESKDQPWLFSGVTEDQEHAKESAPLPSITDEKTVVCAPQIQHAESSISVSAPVEVRASAALPIPAPQVLTPDQVRVAVSIVMDPEKTAQFTYEAERAQAIANGRQPPKEPQTDLSVAQRQEVRGIACTAELCSQVVAVRQKFLELCNRGAEAMFQLPAPFPSLKASDREWISEAVSTEEKRAYLSQIQRRQAALLTGNPLPILDPAGLSAKEQKQVRRIARDLRAHAFVTQGGTTPQE